MIQFRQTNAPFSIAMPLSESSRFVPRLLVEWKHPAFKAHRL
ncbi:hypothetical protein HMPREF1141_0226 [Clostridium sp. MSTE9]|nr:hypothetical protein HMPREF1141_0226 [Clostridium sp. MSTE9]